MDEKGKIQLFYQWLSETYGYIPAQYERFKAGKGVPFSMGADEQSPLYQYFEEFVMPVYEQQQQMADREQMLSSQLPTWDINNKQSLYSILPQTGFENQSYVARLRSLLNQMVYDGAMTPEETDRYFERTIAAIEGGVDVEQLPYYQDLQRADYGDWENWYTRQAKQQRSDETYRLTLAGQIAKGATPEETAEIEQMTVPELEYTQQLREYFAEFKGLEKEAQRQEDIGQQQTLNYMRERGIQETAAGQLKESARARAFSETQASAERPPNLEERTMRNYQGLMATMTPAEAEDVEALYGKSPAQSEFYQGQFGSAARAYNAAVQQWNWAIATNLSEQEMANMGTVDVTKPQVVEEGISYYAPGKQEPVAQPRPIEQFPNLETWTGKYDWYRKFISTPPAWRPGGRQKEALSPRARYYA